MMRQLVACTIGIGLAGCAGAPVPVSETQDAAPVSTPVGEQATTLPPPGYGTLRQDDIAVSLRSGPLLIKLVPLAESVIRLAAPDTYDRLHALAESRRAEAMRSNAGGAELFLVSFFSYQPDVVFRPEDLQVVHRGQFLRPSAILPVSGGWGQQRLQQQETQTAIYVFEVTDFLIPFGVRYGVEQSDAWSRVIPRLEAERNRVLSRAAGRTG